MYQTKVEFLNILIYLFLLSPPAAWLAASLIAYVQVNRLLKDNTGKKSQRMINSGCRSPVLQPLEPRQHILQHDRDPSALPCNPCRPPATYGQNLVVMGCFKNKIKPSVQVIAVGTLASQQTNKFGNTLLV